MSTASTRSAGPAARRRPARLQRYQGDPRPALGRRRAGRGGGPEAKIQVTLHKRESADSWRAFAKPAKRLAPGERIVFADDFFAEVVSKSPEGELGLRFNVAGPALRDALQRHGEMPLPPYIRKLRATRAQDADDYQTVYARAEGAVAAPTAGLHFTPALLAALAGRGIEQVHLTLHVGAGTFLPVKSERIEEHRMHAEARRDHGRNGGGDQPRPRRRPAHRGGRHNLAAAAGIGRRREWAGAGLHG
jgi:hypothetical protein